MYIQVSTTFADIQKEYGLASLYKMWVFVASLYSFYRIWWKYIYNQDYPRLALESRF